jgi:hypothetical protein
VDAVFFDNIHVTSQICHLNDVNCDRVSAWIVKLYESTKELIFTSDHFDFSLTI